MRTTLILVRHGESDANRNSFFAGQLDIALTQQGMLQAELTARYIREHYTVDAVYSSDLQRAYATALPIAKACNLEVIQTPQLREILPVNGRESVLMNCRHSIWMLMVYGCMILAERNRQTGNQWKLCRTESGA